MLTVLLISPSDSVIISPTTEASGFIRSPSGTVAVQSERSPRGRPFLIQEPPSHLFLLIEEAAR